MLVEAATRIAAVLRAGDTLARLGGDEFVVLCEDAASESDTHHLAQRVASALQQPFMLPGGAAHLGGSIGVASAGAAGEDAETLLRHADAAMYRGRGGSCVEALIRWQHPARGLLPAGAFIAMAEESAVIGRSAGGSWRRRAAWWRRTTRSDRTCGSP